MYLIIYICNREPLARFFIMSVYLYSIVDAPGLPCPNAVSGIWLPQATGHAWPRGHVKVENSASLTTSDKGQRGSIDYSTRADSGQCPFAVSPSQPHPAVAHQSRGWPHETYCDRNTTPSLKHGEIHSVPRSRWVHLVKLLAPAIGQAN